MADTLQTHKRPVLGERRGQKWAPVAKQTLAPTPIFKYPSKQSAHRFPPMFIDLPLHLHIYTFTLRKHMYTVRRISLFLGY